MRLMAVVVTLFALLAASAHAADVGFEELTIANGAEPPLTAGVWYPSRGSDAARSGQCDPDGGAGCAGCRP